MTRLWHRRMTRLNNHLPLLVLAGATIAGAVIVIDRLASLGAHAARAML